MINKENILKFKEDSIQEIPTIIISLFLFFTIWIFFGIKNVMLPPFLTMMFKVKLEKHFNILAAIKLYIISIIVCICAYFATYSLIFTLLMNFLVPFCLVFLLVDKFDPKAYFVYVLEMIMLQLMTVSKDEFSTRFYALVYGVTVVIIALYLVMYIKRKERNNFTTAKKGLINISKQLKKMANKENVKKLKRELSSILIHLNHIVHKSRNYTHLTDNYGKIDYLFMILFERFQYISTHFLDNVDSIEKKKYLTKLSMWFKYASFEINTKNNRKIISDLKEINKSKVYINDSAYKGIDEFIQLLEYILIEMEKLEETSKSKKKWKMDIVYNLKESIRLSSYNIRFALKLAIVMGFSFTFSKILGFDNYGWYPIASFFMIVPYTDYIKDNLQVRLTGTFTGIFISFILMSFFHSLISHIIILVIVTILTHVVHKDSWTVPMFTTCYSMVFATYTIGLKKAIILQIFYVFLAFITTVLANKFILPNTTKDEFKKTLNELFDINVKMINEIKKIEKKDMDLNKLRALILKSNLLTTKLEEHIWNISIARQRIYYNKILSMNKQLVIEMEQLASYLYIRKEKMDVKNNYTLHELIHNFEDIILSIRSSYTGKHITCYLGNMYDKNSYGSIDDKFYFNKLAINCINNLNNLLEMSKMDIKEK